MYQFSADLPNIYQPLGYVYQFSPLVDIYQFLASPSGIYIPVFSYTTGIYTCSCHCLWGYMLVLNYCPSGIYTSPSYT
jgi:hypothetical protein